MRVRTMALAAAGAAALLAGLAVAATWPLAGVMFSAAMQAAHPQSISWDGKTAWVKCKGVIGGRIAWPAEHAARCEAMSMCANEAQLTADEARRLAVANDAAGCAPF